MSGWEGKGKGKGDVARPGQGWLVRFKAGGGAGMDVCVEYFCLGWSMYIVSMYICTQESMHRNGGVCKPCRRLSFAETPLIR